MTDELCATCEGRGWTWRRVRAGNIGGIPATRDEQRPCKDCNGTGKAPTDD